MLEFRGLKEKKAVSRDRPDRLESLEHKVPQEIQE
jgi:hypothetical protein